MFKKANKITALLVAATSVMSVVPAMAASTTRLGNKDGTIENAVAFADGKYLFEGYKSDDEDSGLYYNDGSKDKLLDDATEFATTKAGVVFDDHETTIKYGNKYAMAADGSDKYVVDLSTGKVSDEDVQSDLMDNIETKLNSKLKKTDRYTNISGLKIGKVDNSKFAETWYEYTATTNSGVQYLYGFTTDGSKYIDASNLANISIYVKSNAKGITNKVVKVEEFDKVKDGVIVSLTDVKYLAQDKDYIYVKSTVNVTGTGTADGTRYFVQKLSKTQGDKKDDAYLPKSVASYELDKKVVYDDGDLYDAADAIDSANSISVIDGSLYATVADSDNVKTHKIDLKKVKIDNKDDSIKNIDAYVAKQDDTVDQDIDAASAWTVDSNGYTWVINKGKIYKFNKLTKETKFTCDRSLDAIDVYDDNNLIAWEVNGDVYTTVTEGKAETSKDAEVVAPPAPVTGWVKNTDGTWAWNDYTGAKVASKWVNVGGTWYYLKSDGIMATGWYNDNGTWYYLNPASGAMVTGWLNDHGTWYYLAGSGAMATGWLNDNGTWYYLSGSGSMLANTTVNGYRLGSSGAWIG